MNFKSLVMS
uniref:Uncharacterized protein n=1 Tax=Anguilla anguilla TaxID=7936 RepID=A0A0E9VAX0_ANGAN